MRLYSPQALAFLGDAVYELLVRERLVCEGNRPAGALHKRSVAMVRAEAQAEAVEKLLPCLTEAERAVYRRGRNAHVHAIPKNASRGQYTRAAGLEALFGWLYLQGQLERINQLFGIIMEEKEG